MTSSKRVEEALRASEEHLELLRNSVPALIFYLDTERRYVSINHAFTTWFGVSREQILGKTVREFVGEAAWALIEPHLERAYAGEPVDYEDEIPSVRVIGLSMFEEAERAQAMRDAGAVSYLAKSGASESMVAAIRDCAKT